MYKSPLAPEKQNKLNFPPEFVWKEMTSKVQNSQPALVEHGGEICAHFLYIHPIVQNRRGGGADFAPPPKKNLFPLDLKLFRRT